MSSVGQTVVSGIPGGREFTRRVLARRRAIERRSREIVVGRVVVIAGAHCVAAELMHFSSLISAAYAWGVAIWAVSIASTRTSNRGWSALSYLLSAEVLWRMTRAWDAPIPVFWEFGKYAAIVVMIALTRRARGGVPWGPVAYLLLLFMSVPLTLTVPLGSARQLIAFNLSGPVTLAFAAVAALRTPDHERPTLRDYLPALYPATGVAWLALRAVLSGVRFGSESNVAASGGYGPNQVSAILGFALLIAFLLAVQQEVRPRVTMVLIAFAGFFALQGLLTFSRGGMLAAGIALLPVLIYHLRTSRNRRTNLFAVLVIAGGGILAAVWVADAVTNGLLAERYGSFGGTGRVELARADMEIAKLNPLIGVGPGMSTRLHGEYAQRYAAPHTEYTRVVAEHGAAGAVGVILLTLWCGSYIMQRGRGSPTLFLTASLLGWSMLTMAHSAMRLAAVGCAFGLGLALLSRDQVSRGGVPRGRRGHRRGRADPGLSARRHLDPHQRGPVPLSGSTRPGRRRTQPVVVGEGGVHRPSPR